MRKVRRFRLVGVDVCRSLGQIESNRIKENDRRTSWITSWSLIAFKTHFLLVSWISPPKMNSSKIKYAFSKLKIMSNSQTYAHKFDRSIVSSPLVNLRCRNICPTIRRNDESSLRWAIHCHLVRRHSRNRDWRIFNDRETKFFFRLWLIFVFTVCKRFSSLSTRENWTFSVYARESWRLILASPSSCASQFESCTISADVICLVDWTKE